MQRISEFHEHLSDSIKKFDGKMESCQRLATVHERDFEVICSFFEERISPWLPAVLKQVCNLAMVPNR